MSGERQLLDIFRRQLAPQVREGEVEEVAQLAVVGVVRGLQRERDEWRRRAERLHRNADVSAVLLLIAGLVGLAGWCR